MNNTSITYTIGLIFKVTKFRLSLMVAISAGVGYLLHVSNGILPVFGILAGVLLLAGGSSGINQYQERKLDALMKRTAQRPIPSGEIKASNALIISIALSVAGFFVLLLYGITPALLGLFNLFLYNFVYTPLKTKSPLSILPGALVGAVPPMIGWTAAGGYIFHLNIIFIALFMFSWQLPHFWLLLIMYGREYEAAGFSSISKYFNEKQIKYLVFSWTLLTSLFVFFFPLFDIKLPVFLLVTLILLNAFFIYIFYKLIFVNTDGERIRKAFTTINSFMLLVLIIFILTFVT